MSDDPVWFPKPGDWFGGRQVTAVDNHGVAWRDGTTGASGRMGRQDWRQWCCDQRADLPDPDRFRRNLLTDHLGALASDCITELRALLSHDFAPVREGAVYAMAAILGEVDGVDEELRRMAAEDPSPGVREAIADMLEP